MLMILEMQHTPEELITNLELVFQQLDKACFKLSMGKCDLGKNKSSTWAKPFPVQVLLPLKNV